MRRSASFWAATVILAVLGAGAVAQAQGKQEGKAPPAPQVSKGVRKALVAAQKAATEQKWAECISNANDASAVADKTSYDVFLINDILRFCKLRVNDLEGAMTALEVVANSEFTDPPRRAQFTTAVMELAYKTKQYPKAIDYGMRIVSSGGADTNTYLLVASAHYLQNNFQQARAFIEEWVTRLESEAKSPPEVALQLWKNSCIQIADNDCTLVALEAQAKYHPKEETWPNICASLLRRAPDTMTLDVFRLARETGALRRAEEYTEMAQLALERGLPGEAQSVLEQGVAAGLFTSPSAAELSKRLLASAKTQATADRPVLARQERESATNKNGQVDVRIGQAFMSYGQYAEAIKAIERGLGKGNVRNVPDARLSLGIAQLRAGQKDVAAATFKTVEGDELMRRIARLWGLRAR
ncbi:MAG: tetratricopeptide repeat protein [Steroidobacteraceae bacterium]